MATTLVSNATTLYATFNDTALAEKAIGALLDFGGRSEDISLLSKDNQLIDRHSKSSGPGMINDAYNRNDLGVPTAGDKDKIYSMDGSIPNTENTAGLSDNSIVMERAVTTDNRGYNDNRDENSDIEKTEHAAKSGISTTTPGDAASGAAKGAGIGLGLGIAAAAAALFIPGFGMVIGGGALAAAIAGAAGATAAGAVAGGVTGFLKDQGVPDAPALHYSEVYENGGSIVSVHLPSNNLDEVTAHNILAKYQASNINRYESNVGNVPA